MLLIIFICFSLSLALYHEDVTNFVILLCMIAAKNAQYVKKEEQIQDLKVESLDDLFEDIDAPKKEEKNKTHINIVENIYDYIVDRDEKVVKITICDNNQVIFNSIMRKLKEIEEIEVMLVATSVGPGW